MTIPDAFYKVCNPTERERALLKEIAHLEEHRDSLLEQYGIMQHRAQQLDIRVTELLADSQRLDWLASYWNLRLTTTISLGKEVRHIEGDGTAFRTYGATIRDAIDAAMQLSKGAEPLGVASQESACSPGSGDAGHASSLEEAKL